MLKGGSLCRALKSMNRRLLGLGHCHRSPRSVSSAQACSCLYREVTGPVLAAPQVLAPLRASWLKVGVEGRRGLLGRQTCLGQSCLG